MRKEILCLHLSPTAIHNLRHFLRGLSYLYYSWLGWNLCFEQYSRADFGLGVYICRHSPPPHNNIPGRIKREWHENVSVNKEYVPPKHIKYCNPPTQKVYILTFFRLPTRAGQNFVNEQKKNTLFFYSLTNGNNMFTIWTLYCYIYYNICNSISLQCVDIYILFPFVNE